MASQPKEAFSEKTEIQSDPANQQALDELFTRLYEKVRRLAARVRWNGSNPTLNPTALAHEAYMKLRRNAPDLSDKSYEEVIRMFANAMKQILIDAARRRNAQKRERADLPERNALPVEEVLTVTTAIERLEQENPFQARVVQCRFLLGMTVDETAAALGLSERAVERAWREAKASLITDIDPAKEASGG